MQILGLGVERIDARQYKTKRQENCDLVVIVWRAKYQLQATYNKSKRLKASEANIRRIIVQKSFVYAKYRQLNAGKGESSQCRGRRLPTGNSKQMYKNYNISNNNTF
jgi:hypothetical protein